MLTPGAGGLRLMARHRDDSRNLERLVAAAAAGGPGGAMRARAQSDDVPEMASLAVLVSPAPTRFATTQSGQPPPGLARGAAMVVARELAQPLRVAPARLSDLYGLTHAEAAVAVSLAGGGNGRRCRPHPPGVTGYRAHPGSYRSAKDQRGQSQGLRTHPGAGLGIMKTRMPATETARAA